LPASGAWARAVGATAAAAPASRAVEKTRLFIIMILFLS
jgi:hypothetical protein